MSMASLRATAVRVFACCPVSEFIEGRSPFTAVLELSLEEKIPVTHDMARRGLML